MPDVTLANTPPVPVTIDHVKALVKAGLALGQDVAADLSDGKIQLSEYFGLTMDVFGVISAVKSWTDIKSELKNILLPAEMLDLENFVLANFSIPNTKALSFCQDAIATVVSLFSLVDKFKHIKDPVTIP
jgi:hypothetical protein